MPQHLLRVALGTCVRNVHAATGCRGLLCRADLPTRPDLSQPDHAVRHRRILRADVQRLPALRQQPGVPRWNLHPDRAERAVRSAGGGLRFHPGPRLQCGKQHVPAGTARRPGRGMRGGRRPADRLRDGHLRSRRLRGQFRPGGRLRNERYAVRQRSALHRLVARRRRNDGHLPGAGQQQLSVATAGLTRHPCFRSPPFKTRDR